MITNQVYNSGKYNKSLKESRERGFTDVTKIPKIPKIPEITITAKITKSTDVTKIPKITITAKITKITNLGSDNGKHNKITEREQGNGLHKCDKNTEDHTNTRL